MKTNRYIALACATCLLIACTTEQANEMEIENNDAVTTEDILEEVKEGITDDLADFKFHTFIANIPSPLKTFHVLKKAGVNFHESLTNPVEKRGNYTGSATIALNYGIYMADMGYFTLYEQQQQSIRYFAASRELAQELGFVDVLDRVASKRFETNMGNSDSTMVIIDDAFVAMEEYLKTNEQLKTMGLISAGSWLESQHIAVSMLINSELITDNLELANQVYEQKLHLANLLNFLEEYASESGFAEVIEGLNQILITYNSLESSDSVNKESLQNILDALAVMRTKITD
ncbi:MAG: hypothetical protein COB85_04935 [Bacteroidetes bacterium]|nr:MAG: hypothetical protein COB85_04935 [Bacteroidota bacterium]